METIGVYETIESLIKWSLDTGSGYEAEGLSLCSGVDVFMKGKGVSGWSLGNSIYVSKYLLMKEQIYI